MGKLYPKLALRNIRREKRFYLPYFLTVVGTVAALYIASALSSARSFPGNARFLYLSMFMTIGSFVLVVFAAIFLTYTNSFLAKRRRRELGLYNVLGMGKGHIALVLGWEALYLGLAGLVLGLLLGMALTACSLWALSRAMGVAVPFSLAPDPAAAVFAAIWVGLILVFNLLLNLRRVHAQKPAELLRETAVGEREPKTRWLLALLGVVFLGAGYAIALTTRSAMDAIAVYFLAVLLVILGTYCLFTAVSIVVLKALRKNRRFYYRTTHFIGVSGMLHRMKRNAVGLANICILCTMVLVLVSATLSLFLGTQRSLLAAFPGEATMTVTYDPLDGDLLQKSALEDAFLAEVRDAGYTPRRVGEQEYLQVSFTQTANGAFVDSASSVSGTPAYFTFFTPETYEALTGLTVPRDGKAHLCRRGLPGDTLTLCLGADKTSWSVPLGDTLSAIPETNTALVYVSDYDYYAVLPQDALRGLLETRRTAWGGESWTLVWKTFWDLGGDPDTQGAFLDALVPRLATREDIGCLNTMGMRTRADYGSDYYALNSAFFFLGIFLGVIFLLATALIIYYKQLSEGYEDQGRFHIMVQVGLEPRDVKRAVNSQMLVVFFAPLAVAALHVAFDFPLLGRLLTLFGIADQTFFLLCTLGVFAAFALVYVLVYRLTARAYYKIVG